MEDQDYTFEELWPIGELAAKLPPLPGGAKHATSKIYHWLNLGNDPARRTLRSVPVGRYRYCCDRWLREFLASPSPTAKPTRTVGQRERHQAKVKRQLAEAGL